MRRRTQFLLGVGAIACLIGGASALEGVIVTGYNDNVVVISTLLFLFASFFATELFEVPALRLAKNLQLIVVMAAFAMIVIGTVVSELAFVNDWPLSPSVFVFSIGALLLWFLTGKRGE